MKYDKIIKRLILKNIYLLKNKLLQIFNSSFNSIYKFCIYTYIYYINTLLYVSTLQCKSLV